MTYTNLNYYSHLFLHSKYSFIIKIVTFFIIYFICIKLNHLGLKNNFVECMMTNDNSGNENTNNNSNEVNSARRYYPNSPLYLSDSEIESSSRPRPYVVNEGTTVVRRSSYPTPPLSTFSPAYNPTSAENISSAPSYTPTSSAFTPSLSVALPMVSASTVPPISAEVHGTDALSISPSNICTFILREDQPLPEDAYNIWHRHVIVDNSGTRILSDTVSDYSNRFRSIRK